MTEGTKTIVYYAHLEQEGEGCDYTIGCGHALRRLDATTLADAKTEALAHEDPAHEEEYTFKSRIESLDMLKRVRVLEVVEEHDLGDLVAEKIAALKTKRAEDVKRKKLAKIERLKREVEGS